MSHFRKTLGSARKCSVLILYYFKTVQIPLFTVHMENAESYTEIWGGREGWAGQLNFGFIFIINAEETKV